MHMLCDDVGSVVAQRPSFMFRPSERPPLRVNVRWISGAVSRNALPRKPLLILEEQLPRRFDGDRLRCSDQLHGSADERKRDEAL